MDSRDVLVLENVSEVEIEERFSGWLLSSTGSAAGPPGGIGQLLMEGLGMSGVDPRPWEKDGPGARVTWFERSRGRRGRPSGTLEQAPSFHRERRPPFPSAFDTIPPSSLELSKNSACLPPSSSSTYVFFSKLIIKRDEIFSFSFPSFFLLREKKKRRIIRFPTIYRSRDGKMDSSW